MPRYGEAIAVSRGEPVFVCAHVYPPEIADDVWRSLGDGVVGAPGEVPPEYEGATFRWLVVCPRCAGRVPVANPLAAASGVLALSSAVRPTRFA